ncbi:ABC transporter permease [Chitinophaga sp. 212800010-3]|uniref:ABC transporter permease n=1 Tax=unclassified Chitinophaga TaxID=2619133 RepID=UPI002DE3F9FC|nr:FtsX-like permease family protein [Chitinophaga sp. 212800010-3]
MIRNYLRIAWRNLIRNKAFSLINILGLSLGLACSMMMILWIRDEQAVDGFHDNNKQLYQVYVQQTAQGKTDASYLTQCPLAVELKKSLPEIRYAAGYQEYPPVVIKTTDKALKLAGAYAGDDFFRMFSFPLLQGNAATALQPGGVALSEDVATRLFGNAGNAIGQVVTCEDTAQLTVSAVFKIPAASSLQFDFVRYWGDYFNASHAWTQSWNSFSPNTYIRLREDADPAKVAAKMKDFVYHYQPRSKEGSTLLNIQPFSQKYLHGIFKNGSPAGGRIEYVRLFFLLAIFVMLIACINFMNLSTARSAERAREVGIRKAVGALRSSLVAQFIGEALLITFFAILVALLAVTWLLPAFNGVTGKQLSIPVQQPAFWALAGGMLLVTGLVAGSYPALFLSSLNPVKVLKGGLKQSGQGGWFRKGMVVFQFTLSVILITGMLVIYRQMEYVQTKNLGYDRYHLLYVPIEGTLTSRYDLFKTEAANIPGITSISAMRESPTVIGHHKGGISWTGKDPALEATFADAAVGYGFVKAMQLSLVEGRDFSADFGNDSTSYILNETAVAKTGYQHPVGASFTLDGIQGTIIGVVKDFHFNSMHETIDPLVIRLERQPKWGNILVRIAPGKTKAVLAGLEGLCKRINPGYPFTYQFSDMEYTRLYKNEQLVSRLCNYFAVLAIFISCLGLFGLAMFTASRRTREIGVRKVLGASVTNIMMLMAGGFLRPVMAGMLIAFPVAWYIMHHWLQQFAYRVSLDWWLFGLAGLLSVLVAMITIAWQSVQSAVMNPVKSLRTEG